MTPELTKLLARALVQATYIVYLHGKGFTDDGKPVRHTGEWQGCTQLMIDLEQALGRQTDTQLGETPMSPNSRTVRSNHRPTYGRHAPPAGQDEDKKPKPHPGTKPTPKKRPSKKAKR
jgi:hypothetical protein